MPIDWILLGVWAGVNLLRAYGKQQEEAERRRNIVVGVSWTIADEFGGSPGSTLGHFREILTRQFEWHLQSASSSVLKLWRGDFSLKSVPAERGLSWNEIPVNLTATFSRAGPSKTRVELVLAAPPAVEFNRECQKWFYECAKREWAAIFERGRYFCQLWVKVGWYGRLTCPRAWRDIRTAVRNVLSNGLRWSPERSNLSVDAFRRGDAAAFGTSSNGRVKWIEIPATLEVVVESQSPTQKLLFRFLADESADFDKDLKDFFAQSAERELDSILKRLNEFYRRTQWEAEEDEEDEDEKSTDQADDAEDDDAEDQEVEGDDLDPDLKAALETLGLTDAATWREVQATYRRLAKKYHPDAHSSRRPTPKQVKDLEREFSKVTAAYDRLRDFFRD